jgi:hypothetical protein
MVVSQGFLRVNGFRVEAPPQDKYLMYLGVAAGDVTEEGMVRSPCGSCRYVVEARNESFLFVKPSNKVVFWCSLGTCALNALYSLEG